MFVSGFTIARNVVQADYPVKEAILSILPLCDEVIVAIGKSEDASREYIQSIASDKIKIIDTVWDDTLREGGKVLAVETNKALAAVSPQSDWCIYIQADECMHESDYPTMQAAMEKYVDNQDVDGLLFKYKHFYGNYSYLADSRSWYRNEIRIIKNNPEIKSYKDAQGFRKGTEKLRVKSIEASVYHYGWVKHPEKLLFKLKQARKLWHSDEFIEKEYAKMEEFDFSEVDSLRKFEGQHPAVMTERIKTRNWEFEHDISIKRMGLKKKFLHFIEELTGWRPGENKNYKII